MACQTAIKMFTNHKMYFFTFHCLISWPRLSFNIIPDRAIQQYRQNGYYSLLIHISLGESNTVVSAYTMYRHLQQYCSHPSIWCFLKATLGVSIKDTQPTGLFCYVKHISAWYQRCADYTGILSFFLTLRATAF